MIRSFPLIIIFLVAAILLFLPAKKPFEVTSDMALSNLTKKFDIQDKDSSYGFVKYNDKIKKLLDNIPDDKLTPVACSDSFYRNVQGVYIFDNLRVGQVHFVRIKNEEFLEFMREKEGTFIGGKKILTGRICELADKTILLFYSVGIYDLELADTTTVRRAIAYSEDNTAYIDIIPRKSLLMKRTLKIAESENNIHCHSIFQLTNGRELFLLCEESKEWHSNYFVKKISLKNGKAQVLGSCLNEHRDKLKTICD